MARSKVVKSFSLSRSTLDMGMALIDTYGLGDQAESMLADGVLNKAYAAMGDCVTEQTATGVKFKIEIEIEFEEE